MKKDFYIVINVDIKQKIGNSNCHLKVASVSLS